MKYIIVRDGEEFGPYEQENLPSFVADGNVVPTDLARPASGGKTVAVAELLRGTSRGAPALPAFDHAAGGVTPTTSRRPLTVAAGAILALALLAAAAWYFLRVDDRGITTAARYLPANTFAVLTLHVDDLAEKAGLDEIIREQFGRNSFEDNPMLRNLGNSISEMPHKLGLRLDQPLFIFGLPASKGAGEITGFILPVQSRAAVERGIKEVFGAMAGASLLAKVKPADGYRVFEDETIPFVVGFNDDVLVMIGSTQSDPDLSSQMRAIFQKENSLAKTRADFGSHLEREFDVGLWMSLPEILRRADIAIPEGSPELPDLDKLTATLEVRFDNGMAQLRSVIAYDQQQLGDWASGSVDPSLLTALPSRPLAVFAQSLKMETLKKYIQTELPTDLSGEIDAVLEDATDMNLEDLLGLLKGSVMISLNDLRPNPVIDVPSPDFVIGFAVNDTPQLSQLMARVKKNNGRLAGLRAIQRPGALFLCSDYPALQLEQNTSATPGPAHQHLRGHSAGGYVDFALLAAAGEKLGMPQEAIAVMEKFETLTITGDTRPGEMEYALSLTFKDKQRNSLRQLGNLGQMILNEAFRGGSGDATFDENDLPPLKD